ncbi:MAG: 4Fe-4S binding protein [Calditrichaceae bacterium]|nr:4Fe-4S binding protein [Calditrichaceae bacterium]MBN2710215.1 4Fe-4S binding protein [Calditrichaceae bacterium]
MISIIHLSGRIKTINDYQYSYRQYMMKNNYKVNIQIFKEYKNFRIQPWRFYVQLGFLILTIWIGIEFYIFVNQLEQGIVPLISRPAGVEAFLPISALISFKYWILTGIFNTIHPSALVLLLIFGFISILLKKGFCSWICPIGLLSEILAKLHIKIFDRQFKLPKILDNPLRSLKYLLLLFFVWAIFWEMNEEALKNFIYSPYNRIADIKMLHFFTHISETTLWTLAILFGLSLALPYFWCRYLCLYGALMGALSWLSPFKIRRNTDTCTDCKLCTKACPANILVHKEKTVFSDECHACLKCVDVCPVKDTLHLSALKHRYPLSRKIYAWILVAIFLSGIAIAKISGVWNNRIGHEEYLFHIKRLEGAEYFHNQGNVPDYDKQKWQPDTNSENFTPQQEGAIDAENSK